MKVFNLTVGQTLPLAQGMTNATGQRVQPPLPDWSSSNTAVVEILPGTTTSGAKCIGPGTAFINQAGDGFQADPIQINVARPDGGCQLLTVTGTPH